jgi:hypothetical protein
VPTVAVSENTSSSTSQEQATSEQEDAIYTNEVNSVYDNQTEETASPAEDTETSSQQTTEEEYTDGDYTREETIALDIEFFKGCGYSEEEARAKAEALYEQTKAAEAEQKKRSEEALAADIAKAEAEVKKMEERCLQQTGMTRDEWAALGIHGQYEWCQQHPDVDVSGF